MRQRRIQFILLSFLSSYFNRLFNIFIGFLFQIFYFLSLIWVHISGIKIDFSSLLLSVSYSLFINIQSSFCCLFFLIFLCLCSSIFSFWFLYFIRHSQILLFWTCFWTFCRMSVHLSIIWMYSPFCCGVKLFRVSLFGWKVTCGPLRSGDLLWRNGFCCCLYVREYAVMQLSRWLTCWR